MPEEEGARAGLGVKDAGRHRWAALLADEKEAEAVRLRERASELQDKARLEDLTI